MSLSWPRGNRRMFETWLNQSDPIGARIAAEKMFTDAIDG
jgi:hypothetical protein